MSTVSPPEAGVLERIAKNFLISRSRDEFARMALERLHPRIAASGLAVQWTGEESPRRRSRLIFHGDFPLADEELRQLVERLGIARRGSPFVDNSLSGGSEFSIGSLVLIPLAKDESRYGWLVAVNHVYGGFGAEEVDLLTSAGGLLALHSRNRDLYHEQSELVAGVVRAMVSAIDAKDPYTSGHSERVARFAVRIALEMRCDPRFIKSIYLAGLLHDVGKIGINDAVLCKVGRLTEPELEHVKMHPDLGCKILADLRQLSDVLPGVRHHHERWDGVGYPDQLAGTEIPKMARILAVADAYDAMTTDRIYRTSLREDRVDANFRAGAGQQWDPGVVAAFFAAKEDILAIANQYRPRPELEEQFG